MTLLGQRLISRIEATGPISLADYMTECLLDPRHGYYTTGQPIGRSGDFTTAPEVSQMFGELTGLCLAQAWIDQGRPQPFTLAELGPGRGTLMADILRATSGVEGFHKAMSLTLVEASPSLGKLQQQTLHPAATEWIPDVSGLSEAPLFLVANEFFDALPIRQFLRTDAGWRERMVGVADGALTLGLGPETAFAALAHLLDDTAPGQIVEFSGAAAAIAGELGRLIGTHGGLALIIDYGGTRSIGDTLQAVRNHAYDDIFAHPGEADLSAHVDFGRLAEGAAPAAASGPVSQRDFLGAMGIGARAEALAARLSGAALDAHIAGFERLTSPEEMGTLFRVLALHPLDAAPQGFPSAGRST
ncbi:MAG: SAM-dependent methyltransferase [Pseudomonadota bacterium]